MGALSIEFSNPWLLFLLIPAFALTLLPYFLLPKKYRRTRNRITSLIIHIIVLCLCVGLVSGMQLISKAEVVRNEVIFLVDSSRSCSSLKGQMDDFIDDFLDQNEGKVGIITFGLDNVYAAKLSNNYDEVLNDYKASKMPNDAGTDFNGAITAAISRFTDPKAGRIILLTDGQETDNNAVSAVAAAAREGVRIDAVYFEPSPYENEVIITSIVTAQDIFMGKSTDIVVNLASDVASTIELSLYDNKTLISKRSLSLNSGTLPVTFNHTFLTDGVHEIFAQITATGDTIDENNKYASYVLIEVFDSILIIEGEAGEANELVNSFDGKYQAAVINVSQTPQTIDELVQYDQIIMVNVANSDLKSGFSALLNNYVRNFGGSLLTIGGDKAYNSSDMDGSVFQDILPVVSTEYTQPLALMLVMDTSSSMINEPSGVAGKTRLDLAKEGAIECVKALSDKDYIGIVTFNSTAKAVLEMTELTKRDEIIEVIESITWQQGTYYYNGINLGGSKLIGFNKTDKKHMLFITDGVPQDKNKNYKALITNNYYTHGITTSAIALGTINIDLEEVEAIAAAGGGNYYHATAATLPEIMKTETQMQETAYYNAIPFTPTISAHTSALEGITTLPRINGYFGTMAKNDATVVLSNNGAPIYAEWTYGLGKAASLMTSLKWAEEFLEDERGARFLDNVLSGLMPSESIRIDDITVELTPKNFTASFSIITSLSEGQTISAIVYLPNGNTFSPALTRGNTFGTFSMNEVGIYELIVEKRDISGSIISSSIVYTTFSYSDEFCLIEPDSDKSLEYLGNICSLSGGTMIIEDILNVKSETIVTPIDPSPWFLIIIICLFLIEIAARKFKFKLPHEWFKHKQTEE